MACPVLVGWRQVERDVRVAETGVVVAVIEGERHADAVEADVQVGIDGVVPRRGIAIANRRVVVGVGRTHRACHDEGIALGYRGNVLSRGCAER